MHDRCAWQSAFQAQLAAQLCHTAEVLSIQNWTLSFIKKLVQDIKGHTCIYICIRVNYCNLRTKVYFLVSLLDVWHQLSFILLFFFNKNIKISTHLTHCRPHKVSNCTQKQNTKDKNAQQVYNKYQTNALSSDLQIRPSLNMMQDVTNMKAVTASSTVHAETAQHR